MPAATALFQADRAPTLAWLSEPLLEAAPRPALLAVAGPAAEAVSRLPPACAPWSIHAFTGIAVLRILCQAQSMLACATAWLAQQPPLEREHHTEALAHLLRGVRVGGGASLALLAPAAAARLPLGCGLSGRGVLLGLAGLHGRQACHSIGYWALLAA